MAHQHRVHRVERRPLSGQLTRLLDGAFLERHNDRRPPRREQAELRKVMNELLKHACVHDRARHKEVATRTLDDKRRLPIKTLLARFA